MKKILSLILSMILAASLAPAALAEETAGYAVGSAGSGLP